MGDFPHYVGKGKKEEIMNKENMRVLISYIFVGGLTTLVNFVAYYILSEYLHVYWLISNVVAWVVSVIFAFYMNRNHVFKSRNDIRNEASQFFGMRFMTLIIESILLFISISLLSLPNMLSKVVVSIVVVVSNYAICKYRIFRMDREEMLVYEDD